MKRVVTGHDPDGRSIFLSTDEAPQLHHRTAGAVQFYEFWNTQKTPAPIDAVEPREPNERLPLRIPPDPGGTIFRMLDIYPGHLEHIAPRSDGRHPGMHRTETIDYAVMVAGEIYLLLDDSEVCLVPGDVVIQRGTDHAWENRSDSETARIAFILVDGKFTGKLADQLADKELMHETIPQKPING